MAETEKIRTVCGYCGTGCGLVLEVEDNQIVKIRGDKEAPVNKGQTCVKGAFAYKYVHAPNRLKHPMIRKGGRLVQSTWEEAYEFITSRIKSIKDKDGPDAFSMFACARTTNESNYITQKFMRTVIGSNHIDGCNRTWHAPSVAGLATVFGSGFPTNTLEDFDEAEVLLLMGSNTTEAHPIIANRMKKAAKKGLKIIVVDPRKIDMVKSSHRHLQLEVGSDIALINAMIHTIIKEELYDSNFIKEHTAEFDALRQRVERYTPEFAETVTGLRAGEIIEAAREYALAKKSMIAYTLGITEHHCWVNNVLDIANLALLTGHIGKSGTGIMPLRGQNNVQGAGDMGCLPNQLTGAVSLADDAYRKRFEDAWGIQLNAKIGDTQTRTFERMENGEVKALYIIGENPLLADVHMNHTREIFKTLDLLVVQDIFMTETAEFAHVVLPAKSWGESEGTFTNTDRRIQRVRKAVEPQGEMKEDWEILCELSSRLGYPMQYESSEQIWNEIRELAWEMYGGISYERLEKEYSVHYPCPDQDHPGTKIMHLDFHQEGMRKVSKLIPVDYTPPIELPDDEYPFTLTTGRRYESYNTHTQTRYYADGVKIKQTEESLDIHPEDAVKLGIEDGSLVQVRSRRGELQVKAKLTDQVVPGLVFMSFHWSEVPTNVLTINEFDPISGTAEFKACAVSITPLA